MPPAPCVLEHGVNPTYTAPNTSHTHLADRDRLFRQECASQQRELCPTRQVNTFSERNLLFTCRYRQLVSDKAIFYPDSSITVTKLL